MLSVIIPVYNVEKYLPKCLDSVLNQSYADLEIIIINDGSTDSSPTICDEYAAKDDRIKLVHQANGGLSDARNTGMALATAPYITFTDSDDWIALHAYDTSIELLIKSQADLVQFRTKIVGDHE